MYEGYKFNKIESIVLYAISRKRKIVNYDEIYSSLPEIKTQTIDSAIKKLLDMKLIKKDRGKSPIRLNTAKYSLEKIKKMLGEHWESNWEQEWKNLKV